MNLEQIIKNLEDAERTAAIDPNEPQYTRSRSGIETAVKAAKARAAQLKSEYGKALQDNGVAIFLHGPADKVQMFTKLVSEMNEAVVIDAGALYKRFFDIVEPSIGPTRLWTATQTAIMHRLLGEVSKEVKVFLTRALRLPVNVAVPNKEDTLNFIRDNVRKELGDDFNAQYLKQEVSREGLKIRYMGTVVPVIVINATPEETIGLGQLFGKGKATIHVSDEDNVTEDFIKASFKNVQKQIKSAKK